MSRWRIMMEAALLYMGGITLGGLAGYEVAAEIRGQPNMFAGDDAFIAIGVIACFVVAGPFALSALMNRWRFLTYPMLGLCGLLVLGDLAFLVYVLATK